MITPDNMTSLQKFFMDRCLNGVQFMDEMGGPDAWDYYVVMSAVAREIGQRADVAKKNHFYEESGNRFWLEYHGGKSCIMGAPIQQNGNHSEDEIFEPDPRAWATEEEFDAFVKRVREALK